MMNRDLPPAWLELRRLRRLAMAALPPALVALVRRVRQETQAYVLLGDLRREMEERAERQGLTLRVRAPLGGVEHVVSAVDQRDLYEQMARDDRYMAMLRQSLRGQQRQAHLLRIDPHCAQVPHLIAPSTRFEDGRLVVPSAMGLGSAGYLDGEPEGWSIWLIHDIARRTRFVDDEDLGLGDEQAATVLVIGAGSGGVARAVTALGESHLKIAEIDWLLQEPSAVACTATEVRRRPRWTQVPTFDQLRSRTWDHLDGSYPYVVLTFPSASLPEASLQRGIYNLPLAAAIDPARLGPAKWLALFKAYLGGLERALVEGGVGYVLVPVGVRTSRGYMEVPDLHARVEATCRSYSTLKVIQQGELIERDPVAMPFVRHARPRRLVLLVQKITEGGTDALLAPGCMAPLARVWAYPLRLRRRP